MPEDVETARASHPAPRSAGDYARWLIAGLMLTYSIITFERGAPTWAIASVVLFSAVLALQLTRLRMVRAYALWLAAFLVLQALLTPWVHGNFMTLPPRMHSTLEVRTSDLPGVTPGIRHVTTDDRGFRVNPRIDYRAKRGWRIFAIGGSTTEDLFLDDESTWTHLLQEELAKRGEPAEVINTGVSGLRATHHLGTLKVVARLDPDLVIFLLGANDWNRYIRDRFESTLWKPVSLRYSALGVLLDTAVISPLRRNITGRTRSDQNRVINGSNDFAHSDQLSIHRPVTYTFRPTEVASGYASTLRKISRFCKENRLACLFETQPHAYRDTAPAELRSRFWMTPPWATYTLDFESMKGIASLYNEFLKSFAEQEGHPVCDLAARMEPLPRYFSDDMHLTDEGARRVADLALPCVLKALKSQRALIKNRHLELATEKR